MILGKAIFSIPSRRISQFTIPSTIFKNKEPHMKLSVILLAVLVGILILQGCTPKTATKQEPAYVPIFKYSPPATATPASANVTFAIVNATYSENQPWTTQWPFTDFSKNMALDFQELISARGFTVRGPFRSYEEMAYPDKKGTDLVLQPTLDVKVDESKQTLGEEGLWDKKFYLEGDLIISGRVTFSLTESLSKERMWFKSVEIPMTTVPYKVYKYNRNEVRPDLVIRTLDYSDPGLSQPLGKTLERVYKQVMETAWKYLDPGEMAIVKKQADEIKAKKVY